MNVRLRYQNGALTISFGGQSDSNSDISAGGNPGDSHIGGDPGDSHIGGDARYNSARAGGGSCFGGLVLGPIVIPMMSLGNGAGGDPGDSPIGGDPGDSPIGGDPGDSPIGGRATSGRHGSTGCCPTVIGPIVFSGCCPSGAAPAVQALTPIDIAAVLPIKAQSVQTKKPFNMQPQKEDLWCWAAVAVSINDFLDTAGAWTQTTLASSVLQKGCSALPNPGDPCDCVFSLDGALKVTGNLREPKGAYFNQFLNFTDLATYWHSSSFPVCARIVWDDGSGHAHFIALTDCIQLIGGQRLVTVYDPAPGGYGGPAKWDYDVLRWHYQCPPNPQNAGTVRPGGHWNDTYFVQP